MEQILSNKITKNQLEIFPFVIFIIIIILIN